MPERKTKSQQIHAITAEAEPLRPPEYKRNELGQFSRSGNMLAKTQKKTGLNKKSEDNSDKKFGNLPGPGPGRPPGSLNKTTVVLRTAILNALDKLGGEEYLVALGRGNSSAFASLLKCLVPTTLTTENDGGVGVKIQFERHIVWPDGRREIEGATPKSLPAPDPSTDDTKH